MCVGAVCNKMGDYGLKKETVSNSPSPSSSEKKMMMLYLVVLYRL